MSLPLRDEHASPRLPLTNRLRLIGDGEPTAIFYVAYITPAFTAFPIPWAEYIHFLFLHRRADGLTKHKRGILKPQHPKPAKTYQA